jgi:signal transduction histidine kinase
VTCQDQGKGVPAEKLDGIGAQGSGVGITGIGARVCHFNGAVQIQPERHGPENLGHAPAPDD